MTKENIAWLAGIFEGEGSFCIHKEKDAHSLAVTSTDLDVLEKIKSIAGGSIHENIYRNKPSHWKRKYVWSLGSAKSIDVVKLIQPFLLSRRKERSEFYLKLAVEKEERKLKALNNRTAQLTIIRELKEQGKTQQQIAEVIGLERSSISKILTRNCTIN